MKYSWGNLFMGALGYILKVRKLIWVDVELSFDPLKSTLHKVVSQENELKSQFTKVGARSLT